MEFKNHITKFDQPDSHGDIIRPTKKFHIFLWLDDIRNPFINQYIRQYPQLQNFHDLMKLYNNRCQLIWVRNYEEFIIWIKENGLPTNISFDHDLADEHYTPPKYWDDYQASKNYQQEKEKSYKEKTGMDCAKWLVDFCIDYNQQLPTYQVHSANPVGANNIKYYLQNFEKSLKG